MHVLNLLFCLAIGSSINFLVKLVVSAWIPSHTILSSRHNNESAFIRRGCHFCIGSMTANCFWLWLGLGIIGSSIMTNYWSFHNDKLFGRPVSTQWWCKWTYWRIQFGHNDNNASTLLISFLYVNFKTVYSFLDRIRRKFSSSNTLCWPNMSVLLCTKICHETQMFGPSDVSKQPNRLVISPLHAKTLLGLRSTT